MYLLTHDGDQYRVISRKINHFWNTKIFYKYAIIFIIHQYICIKILLFVPIVLSPTRHPLQTPTSIQNNNFSNFE